LRVGRDDPAILDGTADNRGFNSIATGDEIVGDSGRVGGDEVTEVRG
jgi:hypothetical protein